MNLKCSQVYYGFRLIEEHLIEEIDGMGRIFEHVKSGARLVHLETKDTNKVFTLSFKTLPSDNSGVAHILEHAVCCASSKYPLKDTFIEMDKGSLNTSLNACTYKDMTMYYCASQNEKDLLNLMEVYMDLVFHPLIKERPYIFKQEGWHYALEDPSDDISYNGIVYNEMNGDYAEPATRLEAVIHETLFKDTCYQYDSGGKPEEIVKLNEEAFLDFYNTYYKPANCTIFLYGDGDLMKQLALLDEGYLKDFDKEEVPGHIPLQKGFEKPEEVKAYYPASLEEELEDKTILALSFVVGDIKDVELRIALEILEHMLLKSSASPLNYHLISELGLGQMLEESGYDTGKRQPTFSIVLNGSNPSEKNRFKEGVFKVLRQLVEEGIDKDLLEAALSVVIFGLKEGDTPWEAKGVIYSEEVQMSVLYGEHPLKHLSYKKYLEAIQKKADQGYFEELIQKYFIDNLHHVLVVLEPDNKLALEEEKQIENHLKAYKKQLTKKELKALIEMNKQLDDLQEHPNTKEALAVLPCLSLKDIRRDVEPISMQEDVAEGVPIHFNSERAGDIAYLHFLFDASSIAQEDLPYLGLLANLLTYVGTKHYTYSALENQINKQTGGLNCSINAYANSEDTSDYKPFFKISCKVLLEKMIELPALLHEITLCGLFNEKEKIKEIIGMVKYEIERSFTGSPEYRAARRLYTYFSDSALYEDHVAGMHYYEFLKVQYEHFEANFEVLSHKIMKIYGQLMQKNHLQISLTAEERAYSSLKRQLEIFIRALPSKDFDKVNYHFTQEIQNEAYVTSSNVQAIASGFNFKTLGYTFKGTLHVVNNILDSTYLWDKIRLQGGAYGSNVMLNRDGNLVICSYCDPGLEETLAAYRGIGEHLKNLYLEEEELEKYIIGTIGGLDMPLTMEQKSERALIYSLCQVSHEQLQKERDEVLATTLEDLQVVGELFEAVMSQNALCVIGSKSKILENTHYFKQIKTP